MRLTGRTAILAAALSMSMTGSAGAAVEVFLCADPDIIGDSRDVDHAGCSDAISVAQQVAVELTPAPGGGGAANCRNALKPIVVAKLVDGASAGYLLHVLQQRHLRAVDILVRKAAGERGPDFLKMTLQDTVVIGVEQDVESANDPVERISFVPASIQWSFTPQKADGTPGTPVQATLICR